MEYLKRLPFAKPYRWRIFVTILFTVGALVTNLIVPLLLGKAVDEGVLKLDRDAVLFWCWC